MSDLIDGKRVAGGFELLLDRLPEEGENDDLPAGSRFGVPKVRQAGGDGELGRFPVAVARFCREALPGLCRSGATGSRVEAHGGSASVDGSLALGLGARSMTGAQLPGRNEPIAEMKIAPSSGAGRMSERAMQSHEGRLAAVERLPGSGRRWTRAALGVSPPQVTDSDTLRSEEWVRADQTRRIVGWLLADGDVLAQAGWFAGEIEREFAASPSSPEPEERKP